LREVLIISGKGGTGKTSLTASFAHLASDHVICDLDVDAPDLHLLLHPENITAKDFFSGHTALISDRCDACGQCIEVCQFDAIQSQLPYPQVDPLKCEGCNVCVSLCPRSAIDFPEKHCGRWYLSKTRFGPMVHAQLFAGEENSGRLVTLLKREAKALAQQQDLKLILSDGPPGIGCPVISALSGANLAVVVTEPTPSGIHDLKRVIELCDHFQLPAGIIINKHDLNLENSLQIKSFCAKRQLPVLGEIPHDPDFTAAMVCGKTITEYCSSGIAEQLRQIWASVTNRIDLAPTALPGDAPQIDQFSQN
jgi:MinD superfamily P-loop ATPase